MRFSSFIAVPAALVAALALGACTLFAPYRIDIRQGNYIDESMLAQLKPGMTREQVRFALGTPLVADVFHSNRWDYVSRFKSGKSGKEEQRAISVFFDNDRLDRIEGDTTPTQDAKAEAEARSRIVEVPKKD